MRSKMITYRSYSMTMIFKYKHYVLKTILLLCFIVISDSYNSTTVYAEDTLINNKIENKYLSQQAEINSLKNNIDIMRSDLYQKTVEGYQKSCDAANRLISYMTLVATIFGIIIAIAAIYIGYESNKSRKRRNEAIRTLDNAKLYVEEKVKNFDNTIAEKYSYIDKRVNEVIQILLNQLSQETDALTNKRMDSNEGKISSLTKDKLEYIESRIKLFEEIGIPNDPNILYSKAMVLIDKEMLNESIELLIKALKVAKENKMIQDIYYSLGLAEYDLYNYDKSIEYYNEYIKLNTKNPYAYNNIGAAYQGLKDYPNALAYYDIAQKVDPFLDLPYRNKARILLELNKIPEAKICIDEAMKRDKDNIQNYHILARIFLHEQNSNYENILHQINNLYKDKHSKNMLNIGELLNYYENLIMLNIFDDAANIELYIANILTNKNKRYIIIM